MTPEDRVRWDRLRRGRGNSEFMRHLLDLEEREARREEQEAALVELIRLQDAMPAAWQEDAAWDLPEPNVSPIPREIAEATIDLTDVLASWRDAETP
jgi:hypothetical protein